MTVRSYRLSDQADEAFRDHTERLAERWGMPDRDVWMLPSYQPNDKDFSVRYEIESKAEARRFAAIVRDARHYLEVHGYHGEDDPGVDAKVIRELSRLEDSLIRSAGKADDMDRVGRWFRKRARKPVNPLLALTIVAAAVALIVWVIRSCT